MLMNLWNKADQHLTRIREKLTSHSDGESDDYEGLSEEQAIEKQGQEIGEALGVCENVQTQYQTIAATQIELEAAREKFGVELESVRTDLGEVRLDYAHFKVSPVRSHHRLWVSNSGRDLRSWSSCRGQRKGGRWDRRS